MSSGGRRTGSPTSPTPGDRTPSGPTTATGTGRTPSGPSDPDNVGSPTYNPTAPQTNKPTHPGLGSNPSLSLIQEYDYWWWQNGARWSLWMYANPNQATQIKELAWEYRYDPNKTIDMLLGMGMKTPTSTSGSTRSGFGGGGGAGMSKEQEYAAAAAEVRNRAGLLGITFTDEEINAVAKAAVDNKWSAAQLDDYLVPAAKNTNNAGEITVSVQQVQELAARQLLSVSDATAREWAARISSGEMTLEGVNSLLMSQAKLRYSWAADTIQQGISMRDLMLPARDRLANELEMNAEDIDLMDPKWLGMLQTTDDAGTTRAATDSEIVVRARQDPAWMNTRAATNTAANMVTMIRDYFGG